MHGILQILPFFVPSASAQDAVSLEIIRAGQVGTSAPGLIVKLNQDASGLDVQVDCGGTHVERGGPAQAGERIDLRIDAPAGTHTCKGRIEGSFADGSEGEMPLSFTIQVHKPMAITLRPGSLDLSNQVLDVVLDRAASKVEVTALGPKASQVGFGLAPADTPAGQPIRVEWRSDGGEVLKLKVRGFDADGFWSELELVPWSYDIPHEDLVFPTNSSDIGTAEEPKLRSALAEARGVVDRYGADVVIRLYVGGHTDTVGDSASNLRLSLSRARAIAGWFKAQGFPGDIYYQGYGEGKLAVETPDEVNEARNRRAAYILAARPPEASGGSGDYGWSVLR